VNKEAIILAGGFGTRLKDTIPDLPKCLAPVKGQPLLYYIITYLLDSGVDKIIFSLFYKSELVIKYLNDQFSFINYEFVIEESALGTGGALALALNKAKKDNVVVVNGDSIFKIDLDNLFQFHKEKNASFSIALKKMLDPMRYGTVNMNEAGKILIFNEKDEFIKEGIINGGIYIVNKNIFLQNLYLSTFSLETDYLMIETVNKNIFGKIFENYFIDIGVPADYLKANLEL
jgi:D-glycero-alpha-D-manno-heptose 1-phosphate guanylyltransferase